MPELEHVIDVHGVTKRFGPRTVVNQIDMQVGSGEIYGFLGPNGSGKTTFLRMLCGLLTPDAGSGHCLGFDILTQAAQIKRHVGYMTQRFSFYEDLSIAENLDFIARIYEIPDRKICRQQKSRTSWPRCPAHAVGRSAFRWLETAPGSRRLPHSRAQIVAPGRTHRRRGPQGAPRFLGRNSPPRRQRAHRSHHHALHGRGRAVSPPGLHRLRQSPGPRNRR